MHVRSNNLYYISQWGELFSELEFFFKVLFYASVFSRNILRKLSNCNIMKIENLIGTYFRNAGACCIKNRNASEIIFLHFQAIRDGFILGRTQFCSLCSASVYKSNSLFLYWTSWSLTQRQDKPLCYFLSGGLFPKVLNVSGLVLKAGLTLEF